MTDITFTAVTATPTNPAFTLIGMEGLSDLGFVKALYIGLLFREGDAEGVQNWVDALAGGMTRQALMAEFQACDERKALIAL